MTSSDLGWTQIPWKYFILGYLCMNFQKSIKKIYFILIKFSSLLFVSNLNQPFVFKSITLKNRSKNKMQREVEDVYAKNDLILSLGEINAFGLLLIIYIAAVSIIVTKKQIRGEFKARHFGFCGLRARNGVLFVNAVKDDFSSRSLFLAYRIITCAYWTSIWIYSLVLQIENKEEYARLFPNWSDSAIMLYLAVSTFETSRQFCISKEEFKQDNSSENASLMIYLSQFLFEIALLLSFINTALIQTFR